jgi:hypothetical protein
MGMRSLQRALLPSSAGDVVLLKVPFFIERRGWDEKKYYQSLGRVAVTSAWSLQLFVKALPSRD